MPSNDDDLDEMVPLGDIMAGVRLGALKIEPITDGDWHEHTAMTAILAAEVAFRRTGRVLRLCADRLRSAHLAAIDTLAAAREIGIDDFVDAEVERVRIIDQEATHIEAMLRDNDRVHAAFSSATAKKPKRRVQ